MSNFGIKAPRVFGIKAPLRSAISGARTGGQECVIFPVFATAIFDLFCWLSSSSISACGRNRAVPLPNQERFNDSDASKRHERASPAVWRSSAVGAGPVGLGRRLHACQLRSPPKAWRVQQAVGDGWGCHKREALSIPRSGVWRMRWSLVPEFVSANVQRHRFCCGGVAADCCFR